MGSLKKRVASVSSQCCGSAVCESAAQMSVNVLTDKLTTAAQQCSNAVAYVGWLALLFIVVIGSAICCIVVSQSSAVAHSAGYWLVAVAGGFAAVGRTTIAV